MYTLRAEYTSYKMFLVTAIVLFCIRTLVLCESTRTCAISTVNNVLLNNCSLPICTNTAQLGFPVPIEACDRSRCLEIPLEQLRNMGTFRAYTWNVGQKFYTGYCPYTVDLEISENADGTLHFIERRSSGSGVGCSNYTNYIFYFNSPSRLTNGKYQFTQSNQANETWESCYTLFVPGGPKVNTRCRINPPPANGETPARILVMNPVDGNCNTNERIIKSFLKNYPVDWQQLTYDCY